MLGYGVWYMYMLEKLMLLCCVVLCCGHVLTIGSTLWFFSGVCAVLYFIFGCMCLDRFTARAFLSTQDPLVSTAIPATPPANARRNSKTTGGQLPSTSSTTDEAVGSYMSPPQH